MLYLFLLIINKNNIGNSNFKDTHKRKAPYNCGHLGRWYIKLTFFRGSKIETNFPKK